MPPLIDLTGRKFHRLTVMYRTGSPHYTKKVYWRCLCDCGKEVNVADYCLSHGDRRSCGCLSSENTKIRNRARAKYPEGVPDLYGAYKKAARTRGHEFS